MLIDDNPNDNFFHEREIKKTNLEAMVIAKNTAMEALEYLQAKNDLSNIQPDLIFLDIHMPEMDGWEFLQAYNQIDKEFQNPVIIMMLTSSDNAEDVARAKVWTSVSGFITKPLTKENMNEINSRYFN